ncbi:MAG: hypothetical protein ACTSQA_00050 [Candidatus Heimdallarchaeaceae archaeon]
MNFNKGAELDQQIYKEGESTWGCKSGVLDVEDVKDFLDTIKEMIRTWHIEILSGGLLMREIDRLAGASFTGKVTK